MLPVSRRAFVIFMLGLEPTVKYLQVMLISADFLMAYSVRVPS